MKVLTLKTVEDIYGLPEGKLESPEGQNLVSWADALAAANLILNAGVTDVKFLTQAGIIAYASDNLDFGNCRYLPMDGYILADEEALVDAVLALEKGSFTVQGVPMDFLESEVIAAARLLHRVGDAKDLTCQYEAVVRTLKHRVA